ncbi:hypothetical protein EV182_000581 [Spiromyces aspiralis]|uniref:Uncharacterized protein n=1 Tax=Spiromyces aspiralis TaxID=68401 RepID=A0ACC1HPB7_9FUNG|nr:hypothetical protein EV182_000581 [Spiromyces aspiralis]
MIGGTRVGTITSHQLAEYLDFAKSVAREVVGGVFRDGFWRRGQFASTEAFDATDKGGNISDCVTAVDKGVEKMIFCALRQRFVGEETTAAAVENNQGPALYKVTDDPTWIVDPVDGTNNFVHHFPLTAISIALAINKIPVVGVVYLPVLDELYYAAKDMGAFLEVDGQKHQLPLHKPVLTIPSSLSECAVFTEHGSDRDPKVLEARFSTMQRLMGSQDAVNGGGPYVQNLRMIGAASVNLVYVARGAADLYLESGPHAWDFAAGAVLVLESGGAVFDGAGWWGKPEDEHILKPHNIWRRKICAVRYVPQPNAEAVSPNRECQERLAKELLTFVEDVGFEPDDQVE